MLASMTGLQTVFVILYIMIGLLLIGIVLLQKGRGGGIGSAFGGGGGGASAFGAKTGDVFTWVTVVLAGLAILTGVVGNYVLVPLEVTEATPQVAAPASEGTADQSGAVPPAGTPGQTPPGTTPAQSPAGTGTPSSGQPAPQTGGGEPSTPASSEEPTP